MRFDALIAVWRNALPPERFIEIEYESLVAHQERESRRLVDFCGLPWNDACLNFHDERRTGCDREFRAGAQPDVHEFGRSLEAIRPEARRAARILRCSGRRLLTARIKRRVERYRRPFAVELLRVAPDATRLVPHLPFGDAHHCEVGGELERG